MSVNLETLKDEIARNQLDLIAAIEKRDGEIALLGSARERTATAIDDAAKQMTRLEAILTKMTTRIDGIDSKMQNLDGAGGAESGFNKWQTLYDIAEQLHKKWIAQGSCGQASFLSKEDEERQKQVASMLGNFKHRSKVREMLRRKDRVHDVDALISPVHDQDVTRILPEPVVMRQLIGSRTIRKETYEHQVQTAKHRLYMSLTAAVIATDTVIPVDSVAGLITGSTITFNPGAAPSETKTVISSDPDALTITVTALANGYPKNTAVVSDRWEGIPNAQLKPFGKSEFETRTETVITLPTLTEMTRQQADDRIELESFLSEDMMDNTNENLELQILSGSGVGPNLLGILINTEVGDYAQSSGDASDTWLDAMIKAWTQAWIASKVMPTSFVVHPNAWCKISTIKGSDNQYVWMNAPAQVASPRPWGIPCFKSFFLPEATGLTSDFARTMRILDRQQARLFMTDSHESNFAKNIITLLLELRIAMAYLRPAGVVRIGFDGDPGGA